MTIKLPIRHLLRIDCATIHSHNKAFNGWLSSGQKVVVLRAKGGCPPGKRWLSSGQKVVV